MDKKHRQYTKLLDLVKLDEPNRNSVQVQEKTSKLWNDVNKSDGKMENRILI